MQGNSSSAFQLFMSYWELGLLLLTWGGIALLALRRRRDWLGHRFTEQVNFSLNLLDPPAPGAAGPTLRFRTLLETAAAEVWLNDYGVGLVQRAAAATTVEDPLLAFGTDRDRELVNHAVLNVLSERYSEAYLARALGVPVRTALFLFALTWERYGDMRTQKLRVIVVRVEDLEALFEQGDRSARVAVEQPSHRHRLATLAALHRCWRSADPEERSRVGEVELGLPLGTP